LHAGTILSNLPKRKDLETEAEKTMLLADITNECKTWALSVEGKCRKKFLQVIEKCFDEQRRFVFHFMTALTGMICDDNGNHFVGNLQQTFFFALQILEFPIIFFFFRFLVSWRRAVFERPA